MENSIDQRIKDITNNLLPTTGFEDKFAPGKSLAERMAYYHTPGGCIAVINNYAVEWVMPFGVRDSRSRRSVTTETLFQAASISKPIFALAVMRLVQEGRLSLDENIDCYLTSWHVPSNEGWQPRISLRQLLSHSAGMTVGGFPGYQATETLPTVPQILNGEAPANTPKVEANILPGLQNRYSGGGITIAQQVLVDLLQKPFPQIMRELILEPFGMTNSTYQQPLPKRRANLAATGHPWKGVPLKGKYHTYPEMAAAGLWTTAAELSKMGAVLLNILNGKETSSLLTKETIEAMLHPQLPGQKMGEGLFVGLGFHCDGKDDSFHFVHSGWNEGFVADMCFYKNLGKGAVVMLNSNEGYPLMEEIFRAIAQEYAWPEFLPKEKMVIGLEKVENYTGRYASKDGVQFFISEAGGSLMLQYGQQPPFPIFSTSEDEFFTRSVNTSIRFEKDDKASIISLTISQAGNQVKADKLTPEQT